MTVSRLIAGSGRSGTTWVLDALATANDLRPVFEPLHPYVSEVGNHYAHRAISPGDDHPQLRQFLDRVCEGRDIKLWTKYRRQRRWLFPPPSELWTLQEGALLYRRWKKFMMELPRLGVAARREVPLVKCIRANLMLGWLRRDCGWRVVLVVRHPGAVIESELRGSWNAKFALDRFRSDDRFRELTGDRYRPLLEDRLVPVEALALRWLIENQWVMEQAPANDVTVVFYEHLLSSPESEWERIRKALDLRLVPSQSLRAQPSQQSSPTRSSARVPVDRPRWARTLSQESLDLIQSVLDEAKFELYSMMDPNPKPIGLAALNLPEAASR